jgi:hypothetical protein
MSDIADNKIDVDAHLWLLFRKGEETSDYGSMSRFDDDKTGQPEFSR